MPVPRQKYVKMAVIGAAAAKMKRRFIASFWLIPEPRRNELARAGAAGEVGEMGRGGKRWEEEEDREGEIASAYIHMSSVRTRHIM